MGHPLWTGTLLDAVSSINVMLQLQGSRLEKGSRQVGRDKADTCLTTTGTNVTGATRY
jgi:hypothetical protein